MSAYFNQLAANQVWAINLDGFIGRDKLQEALQSGDEKEYRKHVNSLSLVASIKDGLEQGKSIVFFTSVLAESPEQHQEHLEKAFRAMGFLPLHAAPLINDTISAPRENIVHELHASHGHKNGLTLITDDEQQLAMAVKEWDKVRILQKGEFDNEGIKNPDWLMFFMSQSLTKKSKAPVPA